MIRTTNSLTADELLALSGTHVAYEAKLFAVTCLLSASVGPGLLGTRRLGGQVDDHDQEWAFRMSLLIEAPLLHARCLLDFIYPTWDSEVARMHGHKTRQRRSDDTDVIATDFFASGIWPRPGRPPYAPGLARLRERANWELAHLTTQRMFGQNAGAGYEYSDYAELWEAFKQFVRVAASDRLHEEVRSVVRRFPSVIPKDLVFSTTNSTATTPTIFP